MFRRYDGGDKVYRSIIPGFFLTFSLFFALFVLIVLPLSVGAEAPTVMAVGEYIMGEGETPAVAKERALMNAIRAAAENTAVYIESYSKDNNLTLTKDEASVLARAVVEVTDKHYEEFKSASGGICFRVTISARVSSDNLNLLRSRMQDKLADEELKQLQASYDESQRELEQLKRKLAGAVGDDKRNIEKSIAANEQRFTAAQWFERGYNLMAKEKNCQAAIMAFSEAIALNPLSASAYTNRGSAYAALRQHEAAFADYTKAIELDPQNTRAYYNRGNLFYYLMQYKLAIVDYDKAIAIDPQYEHAYNNRGLAYYDSKQYQLAMADFDKALELDPQDSRGFFNRGLLYADLKQYKQAIANFDKAVSLEPHNAAAFTNRGYAFFDLEQYEQAIADFDRVIEITPRDASVYFNKGLALSMLNRNQEAIAAFRKCVEFSNDYNWSEQAKKYIRKLDGQP